MKDFHLSFALFVHYFCYAMALKSVDLEINPQVVRRGESSTLRCIYDLEGAQLYTVKWYRGRLEFYRYTPSEHPSTKVFAFSGAHVDLDSSNEHQVVLSKVGFNLSGNFSCEVTTEAPFSTDVVYKDMLVVVLPEPDTRPTLITDKSYYVVGDVLRANCSSPPSRPAATLTYFLNNNEICQACETRKLLVGDLFVTELSLEIPLFPSHFTGGRLVLRCQAQIAAGQYKEDAALRLDNSKDPVPEKVTYPNGSCRSRGDLLLRIGLFSYLILILR